MTEFFEKKRAPRIFFILWFGVSCLSAGCAPISEYSEPVFVDRKIEKKADSLRKDLRINPDDVETRVELARTYMMASMFEEAIVELERSLDSDVGNIKAKLLLASALQKRRNPDLSYVSGLLEKAVQEAPDNADVYLSLALVYDKQKEEEKAMKGFVRALELSNDPGTLLSAHLGLMAIYKRQGRQEQADEEYKKACGIYPDVDALITEAEVNNVTPPPAYGGSKKGDGIHSLPDERIKRLKEKFPEILEKDAQ